ncbi:MAG: 16S rRNA (cytosine(967)-C(5))-methyltransferase RsmB [Intestinibaculum porci]|uniref:16S rRNA (cytosine(967)-C(5))-methyltransferase RsmB n=1 Tax=Intestinibaculum porci TaxID=2487118 RepID=UPI003F05A248
MERDLALDILVAYEKDHTYLNIALNHALNSHQVKNDLVTALVYGTIQYRLRLEYELKAYIQGKRVKVTERMLLLMSMYEHLYMHMPDYAIVDSSVALAKKRRGARAASFVNAVLRASFAQPADLSSLSEDDYLSIITSHPLWLVKMLKKQYGLETTKKILAADNEVPIKCARVNTLKISREALIQKDPRFKASPYTKDAVYYEGGNIAHTQAFKEGFVTIQDESSQCVAQLLSPQPGMQVLDMCAAPGSKTTHLAALMDNQGMIDAFDLYKHKIALINDNASRLGATIINAKVGDATNLETFGKKQYDAILLDGPCTGLGVLARKVEIRYHEPSAMDEIIPIQKKLLENAYQLCKMGGNIVYSTCTINKKENEKQVATFVKDHPDMRIVEEKTILPFDMHSDGFYMCLLKKDEL